MNFNTKFFFRHKGNAYNCPLCFVTGRSLQNTLFFRLPFLSIESSCILFSTRLFDMPEATKLYLGLSLWMLHILAL